MTIFNEGGWGYFEFNEGAYLTFKSVLHQFLNLF